MNPSNHAGRMSRLFLAALLALSAAETARADFIYQFTTTTPTNRGARLSVTIVAPDSAVATGFISSANITSLTLQVSGETAPFSDFTSTDKGALLVGANVSPTTGLFTPPTINTPFIRAVMFFGGEPEQVSIQPNQTSLPIEFFVNLSEILEAGFGQWTVTPPVAIPAVTCSVAQSLLWPPNNQLVNIGLGVTVTPSDASLKLLVYANDNASSADAANIAPGTLQLRSTRRGNGDGRIYLIVAQASNAAGTGFDVCAVVVPHDQSQRSIQGIQTQAAAAVANYRQFQTVPTGFLLISQ